MADITVRKRQNGGNAYLARIRIKDGGKVIYKESKTLETHKRAEQWIRERKVELARPGALDKSKNDHVTLGEVIDRYTRESRKEIGRTKEQVLETISAMPIAGKPCAEIKASDITALASDLAAGGRKPATVSNYLSHLAAIFAVARPAWNIPLDQQAMEDARVVTKRLGVIGKSQERDRRPTLAELDKLMTYFAQRHARRPSSIPMVKIIAYAIFSTRRQEEIVTLRWSDFEPQHERIKIRDMKDPDSKEGNDVWCDLTPEAVKIMQSMAQLAPQVFPYTTDAISAAFTRACKMLMIEDLHFHDLRHDGISRLFEIGWRNGSIPHVALVSGHRSWKSLQRYTHVRQTGDKYEGWKWMRAAITPSEIQKITAKGGLPRALRSERNARQRVRLQPS